MTEMVIFNFCDQNIRTMTDNGEVLFRASDVAEVLGMRSPDLVRNLDEDDVHKVHTVDSLERTQEISYLTESGLYVALLRSNKAEAKPFVRWVTREVLPQIRKMGMYQSEQLKAEIAQKDEIIMQLRAKKQPRGNLGYHYVPEVQPALDNFEPTVLYRRVPNAKLNLEQLKAIEQNHTLRTLEGLIQKIVADNGHRACYDIFSSLFRKFIPE